MKQLTIATRESPLAVWQANYVKQQLLQYYPRWQINLLGITTKGDQIQDRPLAAIGGKGLFLKELQQALLDKRADLAVHSMKDVPNETVAGLTIAAICERGDVRDVLVSPKYLTLAELPLGARLGTCSVRRSAQCLSRRPDLSICDLRGNVNTRLTKLAAGEYDAIVLAAAGLQRLHLADHISQYFTLQEMLPSVAQGALGVECRSDDEELIQQLQVVNHADTQLCVLAERAFTERLGGNCHSPIGVYAQLSAQGMEIEGIVISSDGKQAIRETLSGAATSQLGVMLAEQCLQAGAAAWL